jgi:hypothetical protein
MQKTDLPPWGGGLLWLLWVLVFCIGGWETRVTLDSGEGRRGESEERCVGNKSGNEWVEGGDARRTAVASVWERVALMRWSERDKDCRLHSRARAWVL